MFNYERGPDIEMVPNASEFLGCTCGIMTMPRYVVSLEGPCSSMTSLWSQYILVGIH
jgi:hypothetical protein